MNIDKSKLRIGIWYEDDGGNMYKTNEPFEVPNDKCKTYHTCFPLQVDENIRGIYNNKDTCKHPLKYRKRTHGWVKGVKGCECMKCGKDKVGKLWMPFVFMKWNNGKDSYNIMTGHTTIGSGNEDVILAMANSGDYTLSEAIVVFANACERCMNVLAYNYTNGSDGYAEYSDEWKKANTECNFCKN